MQVAKVKGKREEINDYYMGKKTGRTTLAIWFWDKAKPQIPPTEWGSGHLSDCNRGCTELGPAGHNCTNGTYLGWLLPGVGFVQCGDCNHQWKETRLGSYSPGGSVQLPIHPVAQILIIRQDSLTATNLAAHLHTGATTTIKPGVYGQRNSEASLFMENRTLTNAPHISPQILGSRWKVDWYLIKIPTQSCLGYPNNEG